VSAVYAGSMGGGGTGDSLQLTEGRFMPGMPTPGAGIPAGGLVLTPQVEKASKSKTKKASSPAAVTAPVVEGVVEAEPRAHVAMVIAAEEGGPMLWWLGSGAIAAVATFGVVYARRVRRTEWDIIEET
jgi:hypothetical protein